jgi:hypothetical protein
MMAVPTSGDLPLLGALKQGLDPLLGWSPDWIHSAVWTFVVYGLGLGLLTFMVRRVLPWAGRVLQEPVATLLNGLGITLVLPEYVTTRTFRRLDRRVPRALFGYGDAIQSLVLGAQRAARGMLSGLSGARGLSTRLLALAMLLVLAAWNGTYCNERGQGCQVPSSEWADSVEAWIGTLSEDDEEPQDPPPVPA